MSKSIVRTIAWINWLTIGTDPTRKTPGGINSSPESQESYGFTLYVAVTFSVTQCTTMRTSI